MRTAITVTIALVVGVAAGVIATHTLLGTRLQDALNDRDAVRGELDKVKTDMQAAQEKAATLERTNRALEEQFSALQIHAAAATANAGAAQEFQELAEALFQEEAGPPDPMMAALREGQPDSRPREREDRRPGQGPWQQMSEEQREQMRQQWEERREQMRAERENYFAELMAAAPTKEARDRLTSIREYEEYLRSLRDAMRDADTDEERQAVRDAMMENARILRDLVEAQRDDMLRQTASKYGVTDRAKQDAFLQSLQELETSPFFREYGRWGGPGGGGLGFDGRRPGGSGR